MSELLKIENLHVSVGDKELLHGINLTVEKGKVHVIMGVNGAGKSTLMHAIMGNPAYKITKGRILFEGQDITELSVDKRAKLGIFLSFQSPVAVAGITMENFIRTTKTTVSGQQQKVFAFKKLLKERMNNLSMDASYAERYLNDGFSGGERKKSEILQLRLLEPKLALLDETDSGLDVDAVRIVSKNISEYHNENNSILLITHLNQILQLIKPDVVHILIDGQIVREGGAELADEVEQNGFDAYRLAVKGDGNDEA
ncbi:MAG: Fe-S cluster assembly ATPase SufC [Acholeplasmataceae bacterium]|nr:Fe-S cluster assembly ATPase SufC [Acholeplasmataceae bacterium]